MGKKRRILVAALVLAVVGGVVWLAFYMIEREPVYQGKRLSEWLEVYYPVYYPRSATNTVQEGREAAVAVNRIGTNAIPVLLQMLRARDSALTAKLLALAQRQNLVRIRHVPASFFNRRAATAFSEIGPEAKGAGPSLIGIYQENISLDSRMAAMTALGLIGPPAEAAVPLLVRAATDTNVPSFLAPEFHRAALEALGNIHSKPEYVVPILASSLRDPDWVVRLYGANALLKFGTNAQSAIPILIEMLNDPNSSVRHDATNTMKAIDSGAVAPEKR